MALNISKPLFFAFTGFCVFTSSIPVLSADPPNLPPGSSPEVIEKKAREKIKEELEEKFPAKVEVEAPQAPEKKAGETAVLIRKIRLKPHSSISHKRFKALARPHDLRPLIAAYEGRTLTLGQLNELGSKIEQVLRARGYFAVVRVPPQKIERGVVILEVLPCRACSIQGVYECKLNAS